MLDQDTACALLAISDECAVRVALLGDRHQLAAVGRGGVLDLAVRRRRRSIRARASATRAGQGRPASR